MLSTGTEANSGAGMSPTTKKILWIVALVVLYFVLIKLPTPAGLTLAGQQSIALMVVVVISWVTEVVPIAVSSLFFVFIQHIIGIQPMGPAVANFANPTLLFVLSAFFLSIALGVSGLGKRISMKISIMSKGDPGKALLYIMLACGALSTVVSDPPCAAAFFPIGLALLEKNDCKVGTSNYGKAMMIGIPFAALIGGVGTPAGSSLNVLALSLLKTTSNIEVSFIQWTAIGIPLVIITLPLAWKLLMWMFPPEMDRLVGIEEIEKDYKALGPLTKQEIKFITIFALMLITWVTESWHKIPLPATITIGAVLFFLPGIDLLTWENSKNRIGWDTILLIGAASSLGTTLWKSGAALWIAKTALAGIAGAGVFVAILFVVVFTILIHLLVPVNPAIVSIMVPSLGALAVSTGINPAFLVIPMAFTVSAAFLLPLDPVPLITYPARYYSMVDYFKGGWPVCILWTIVMTAGMLLLARPMGLI